MSKTMSKTGAGNFFEDFRVGQLIKHATPRTINAVSEVIGLKENSSRKTGIVFVRTTGCNQDGSKVLEYVRWVMLRKRDEAAPAPGDHVPRLPEAVLPSTLGGACPPIDV